MSGTTGDNSDLGWMPELRHQVNSLSPRAAENLVKNHAGRSALRPSKCFITYQVARL